MAFVGHVVDDDVMFLTAGRDMYWGIEFSEPCGAPVDVSHGDLFFEFDSDRWFFTVDGHRATLKVESEVVDLVPDRARWQLVFLPAGEAAGGVCLARGYVRRQK